MFCTKCGNKLKDDDVFCPNCGQKVVKEDSTKNVDVDSLEKCQQKNGSERTIVQEGAIHKCPNCGEVLKSFETTCPTCGHEVRDRKSSESSIEEFSKTVKRIQDRAKKIDYIISYYVPNTKEDIYEFMIFVNSQIKVFNRYNSAWISKGKQLIDKGRISLKDDKRFHDLSRDFEKAQKRAKVGWIGTLIGISSVVTLTIAAITSFSIASYIENRIPEPQAGETILVDYDSNYFVDKMYTDVQVYFVKKGFESVTTNPMGDLITGWIKKENTVDSVSINGNSSFKKKWYKPTDVVVIYYHSFK